MSTTNRVHSVIKNLGYPFIGTTEELEEIEELEKNKKEEDKDIIEYTIMIIGDNETGKSSFCNRFALDLFDLEVKPSIETSCYCKTIILFDKEIKIYLIDMETCPISPLTKSEEDSLYQIIDGIILIYDITEAESFKNTEKLFNDIKKNDNIKKDIPVTIVGNKNDLGFLRNIDFDEAKEKAANLGYELKEINCNRDTEMVHNVMKKLIEKIYFNNLDKDEKEQLIKQAKE